MDICIASDSNYAMIMEVVMASVMDNNRQADSITFHIFEDGFTDADKTHCQQLTDRYGREVLFYNVAEAIMQLKEKLNNDWANRNSYVAYARLLMPIMLPKSVKRFLYLDCDTLVVSDIRSLFSLDMEGNTMAGIRDVIPYFYLSSLGQNLKNYYNSGVLLIDSELWNRQNLTEVFLKYCETHQDDSYPDQDAINILLNGKIKTLPPRFCVFFPEYSWSPLLQYYGFGNKEAYYSEEELNEARTNPAIIHYVDSIWGRPWQTNNINPYSDTWMKYYRMIDDNRFEMNPKPLSRNQKIFRLMGRILPKSVFGTIYYMRRNNYIKGLIK